MQDLFLNAIPYPGDHLFSLAVTQGSRIHTHPLISPPSTNNQELHTPYKKHATQTKTKFTTVSSALVSNADRSDATTQSYPAQGMCLLLDGPGGAGGGSAVVLILHDHDDVDDVGKYASTFRELLRVQGQPDGGDVVEPVVSGEVLARLHILGGGERAAVVAGVQTKSGTFLSP